MSIQRIFLDMDGVLADYNAGCLRICNTTWEEVISKWAPSKGFTMHEPLGLTEQELDDKVSDAGEEFWSTLPEFPWTRSLYYTCQDIAPTCILTNPHKTFKGAVGKIKWLRMMFGDSVTDVLMGKAKGFCAAPGHVLIDDKESNCEQFRDFGGDAILFPQYWNSRHTIRPQAAAQAVMNDLRELGGIK